MSWNPMERWHALQDWVKNTSAQPKNDLTTTERLANFSFDLVRHGTRQLRRDRAPQMAAALAFRTLFSLLPVLVVATVVVRAVRGIDAFMAVVDRAIEALQLDEITMSFGETGEVTSFGVWLRDLIGGVENINLAAIGWVGLVVLIYAAISLVVTIENSFNSIYGAPEGRRWWQRILTYWFVLTVGPVVIGVTMLTANKLDAWVAGLGAWQWLVTLMGVAATLGMTTAFMFTLYVLVPNAEVAWRPALIGAFVAAVLIEIGKGTLDAYLQNAISIRQLYGSLGLIPLFMFWTYIMWLVVLFGLEVAATLQKLSGRRLDELDESKPLGGVVEPASVLVIMQLVAERFKQGQPATGRWLSEESGIRDSTTVIMVERLIERGLLHRLDGDSLSVSMARPAEQVTAAEVMDVGFALADEGGLDRAGSVLKKLRDAQKRLTEGMTVASLSRPSEAT